MNSKQWFVLSVAVGLFSLSELFPPWMYEDTWDSGERSAGYHFILAPEPEVKSQPEMKKIYAIPDSEPPHNFTVRTDLIRLYGQRLTLLFLMVGFLIVLGERRSIPKIVFGGVFLLVGIGFLALYIFYVSPYL